MEIQESQIVDVGFPVRGPGIPLDHGYLLFSALSRALPELHREGRWGVHPVLGVRDGNRLGLEHRSRVKIRIPLAAISAVLPLSGTSIQVAGSSIELGFPQIFPLVPAADIRARFVTIRGFEQEEEFLAALRRQLSALEDLGQEATTIELVLGRRRVMRIHDKKVVGFALGLTGLGAQASLAIQCHGLGGRRHMGGGIFVPPGKGR